MIIPSKMGVTLICDICGEEIDGFFDFEDAIAHKKETGWISEKYRGEWQDICPECQGVNP